MNTLLKLTLISTLLMIFACSSTNYVSPQGTTWTKLGATKVAYRLDKDEIKVGPQNGTFNHVKVIVKQAPINFHRCVVHFGNGDTQTIQLRKNFLRGSSSAVHDLHGGNRVIKKIVFWYDTKNPSRQRATVELWARR